MPAPTRILPLLIAFPLMSRAEVVISEIMYHPSSGNPAEEYIELTNTGASAVDLSGWKLSGDVSITFPAGSTLASGGYLAVTASPAAFQAKYPSVTAYVSTAGWAGTLPASGRISVKNAAGLEVDSVAYASDGDWARREQDNPPSYGHRGWQWKSAANDGGKSLELINAAFDNSGGQNWIASDTVNGTPGAANSTAAADIAPVITRVSHFPLNPASADPVTVTARVKDDHPGTLTVALFYRNDGAASFTQVPMFDDGAHSDGLPGDGIFAAELAPRAAGTIVEFYIQAADAACNTRDWPAQALDYTGSTGHFCNCLYQVEDTAYNGTQPIYRVIMKAADRTELANINSNTGAPPFAYNPGETADQTLSEARFNAAFLAQDGTGSSAHYLSGVRNRGSAARSLQPQSLNVQFTAEAAEGGPASLNLNGQNTPYQLFGSALLRRAGLIAAESRAVQLRINGVNEAGTGHPAFGFYACNEAEDADFARNHFPLDPAGNLYRGVRSDGGAGADLRDQSAGSPPASADPAPYRVNYRKETNLSEDRWADLIGLTKTLAKGQATSGYALTWDADYTPAVEGAVDVKQWMTTLAASTLADNNGATLFRGDGNDYHLYFGATDPRARLIPWDLDTLFNRANGTTAPGNPTANGIFRMAQSTQAGNPPTPLYPLMARPEFALAYFQELQRLLEGPFSTAQFNALADQILGPVWDAPSIQQLKDFNTARASFVRGLLPQALSGITAQTTGGTALTVTSGYPQSTTASCRLTGKADCSRTASVKVNGVTATYTPWQVLGSTAAGLTVSTGDWVANPVALTPGVNRLRIQAFDSAGQEIALTFFDVWYDDGSVATFSGALSSNTTWTAAGGPYQVTANLTVNSGVTLTIQPGTSVYLASGVTITAAGGGRILAEGTASQPIRFTRAPGATTNGGTITINGQSGAPESHFYYTFFEFGGDPALVCAANSNVVLDHCEWLRNTVAYLHLDGGSFLISNCIFPSAAAGTYFEGVHGANAAPPAGGRAIIRDSFFGRINSISSDYNDVLDFTGGNRPGPILQFYNNVMTGTDDDLLDLDGTDAWIENNIFMHVHRSGSPDSASAISGGNDGGGGTGSRKSVSSINTTTDVLTFGSSHGFSTGQEIEITALLGNSFPAATPALHNGGPYFVRSVSTTTAKLYLTAADANADTGAVNFSGSIATGVSLSLTKLDAISHITIVGNVFYDMDQAATAKEGNFYTFLNNTVIAQSNAGSQDTETGVLNFGDDTYHESGGMYAEGNVIHSATSLVRNYPGAGLQQTVTWNKNIFPPGLTWTGSGSGNTSADAALVNPNIPTPGPYDYHRLREEIRRRIGLQAHSPGIGTGPNGADSGADRPIGVSIGGAPAGTTNLTTATLTIGTRMTGSGIPAGAGAWTGGSGWTHYKWRLDGGAWSAETAISTPITLTSLSPGTHTVDVTGKNDAGTWQDSADLGDLARLSSVTWTVNPAYVPPVAGVQLSEVLARNTVTQAFGQVYPDVIELYNGGSAAADLTGWGLTDESPAPYKYTFPAGTTLAPGAYLTVYATDSSAVPLPRTGFSLTDSGSTLTLTKSPAAGGGIADSVSFGWQAADLSIGRRPTDSQWDLCRPTFGAANATAGRGTLSTVKINEWLAEAAVLAPSGIVELFNSGSLPVDIGGAFLTNNPQGWANQFTISPLSYIGASGYVYFQADGNTAGGAEHLNFELTPSQGEIGLSDSTMLPVDHVVYGPQSTDVSQGRSPNGGVPILAFTQPTPGSPNPQASAEVPQSVDVILPTQSWKYVASATDPFSGVTAWKDPGFNDAAWSSGGGVLYLESSAFPANTDGFSKVTLLPGHDSTHPYQTYYFRTHFTYNGSLNNVTFTAKMMCDDAPILYLNGQEITPVSGSRIRLPAGADTYALQASSQSPDITIETYSLKTNGLVIGDNVLAVSMHQNSTQGAGTGSSDVTWGMKLSVGYTAPGGGADTLVINEVLTTNTSQQNPDGSFSGWVELHNSGATPTDLSGLTITNDVSNPAAFTFPAGTSIAAGGYLVLYCNGQAPATAAAPFNSGFPLNSSGGGVFVFKSKTSGGGLLTSINYGSQLPDLSIGRIPSGTGPWTLNTPTRSALNVAAATAPASSVKLNEWLADGTPGWLELYNTSTSPAAVGGICLSDDLTDRSRSPIPPLSYIGGTGPSRWQLHTADGDSAGTPLHVNFTLEAGEGLGLFSSTGSLLDSVPTTARPTGSTQGRLPDGTGPVSYLLPTPAAANLALPGGDLDGDGLPDDWELAHGLDPNNAADALLDGDFDGANNLLEFAFNLDPEEPDAAPSSPDVASGLPFARYVSVPGGNVLEIVFLRRRPPAGAGLSYTAEFSSGLTDWSAGLTPVVTPIDADWEWVTVRDSAPPSSPRRYTRVSVSTSP